MDRRQCRAAASGQGSSEFTAWFCQSFAGLPQNSQLVILGKGSLEHTLKALALELGIGSQVLFLGQVPQASLYYKAFDVLL